MKRELGIGIFLIALLSFACSSDRPNYICTDNDGDHYGLGLGCEGLDCNDSDASCFEGSCCLDCTDLDGDGYGSGDQCDGPDCNDSDSTCHEGDCCVDCLDFDRDGYGTGADCAGADCNDSDFTCHEGDCCQNCLDNDGDGYGVGDDCRGPDCDDTDSGCHEGACCTACTDLDGDGYGVGDDCLGADCDDNDGECHEGACCLDCNDLDGDGYGTGDDCLGADCNESDPACHEGACCLDCTDLDGDGYGVGDDCAGADCDDSVASCNTDCTTDSDGDSLRDCDDPCLDADGDGYGVGDGCAGIDCDDTVASCNTDCVTDVDNDSLRDCDDGCLDVDGDGYGTGPDCTGPDCNNSDPTCHEGACCLDCTDLDGDGYGEGDDCTGADCDDTVASCNVDCTTDSDGDSLRDCDDPCLDADGDNYGSGPGCTGADCDDTVASCNTDCATDLDSDSLRDCDDPCVDVDGDNYGTGPSCTGADCDDSVASCNTDCATDLDSDSLRDCDDPCVDVDGDGYGTGPLCTGADCDDAVAGCNVDCTTDSDGDSLRDCDDPCLDADGDNYGTGPGCTGADCDDAVASCNTDCTTDSDGDSLRDCDDPCVDVDGDGYGTGPSCTGADCDDAVASCNVDCTTDSDGDSLRDCDDPCVDADSDGYGTGPACLGADCDDGDGNVHPGVAEDCVDSIDNNCDGLTDLEDVISCPPIDVTISTWADPREVSHGHNDWIWASITPDDPNAAAPFAWPRVWSVIDAQPAAACNVADVVLSNQGDWQNGTQIQATMPDVLAKKDCIYTLQIAVNQYATDIVGLKMVNRAPQIQSVSNAVFDGSAWRLHVAAGSALSITAQAWDQDNDSPLNFDWEGPDVGQLSCAATSCQSSDGSSPFQTTVNWAAPTIPGTYYLTVKTWDDFEPTAFDSADVVVEVENCVWVVQGGSGTGTLANPLGSIASGLTQASLSPATSTCVIGAGTFTENLVLPVAPNMPDMLGGFDAAGNLSADRPAIVSSVAQGLTFAVGHSGRIHHFNLQQTSNDATTVTIEDASPEISDCWIRSGAGASVIGVYIHAQGAALTATAPTILGSQVQVGSSGNVQDATAIKVEEQAGADARPHIVANQQITVWSCSGTCRGIHLLRGTWAEIRGNQGVQAGSDDVAIGIDLDGRNARPVTAVIDGNQNISADSQGARAIAINLWRTTQTEITNNMNVGVPWTSAGRELGLGIADGYLLRDGSLVAGNSDQLTISGNRMISGGASWWAQPCSNPGDTGEGADVTAGILLVGSQDVTITDNGRPNDQMAGIFGGSSTIHWDPMTRRLPPSSIGLWLIDTQNVVVISNEIRSGSYASFTPQCPNPDIPSDPSPEIPVATAYRDGLPPNDDMGAGFPGELPSRNTLFLKNGASCAEPPENGAMGAGIVTWCTVVEMNVPQNPTAPLLTNNHLAATKGNFLIALWQRGGNGVVAANNTFDSDLILKPWDPLPPANSIRKWAVYADNIDADGLDLVNNIFYTHEDNPYDIVNQRLCMMETVPSGVSSNITTLDHNLFYIEGDDLSDPTTPAYVRVTDFMSLAGYAPDGLNAIVGIGNIGGNFAALPGMLEYSQDWQKSMAKLAAGSAAIDAGTSGGAVPPDDIDGEARPDSIGLVDIGHDEFYP